MIKLLAPAICLLLSSGRAFALPDWADDASRAVKYPRSAYFGGYGLAYLEHGDSKDACLRQAENLARRKLAESIQVGIRSELASTVAEKDGQLSHYVASTVNFSSRVDAEGMFSESFADEKTRTCHAFVFIKRKDVARTYEARVRSLSKELEARIADGASAERTGNRTGALAAYRDAFALFARLEEARAVALSAGGQPGELPSMEKVRSSMRDFSSIPVSSVDDMAGFLLFCLGGRETAAKLMVSPFTFKDSRMSSPLGRYFKQALEGKAKLLSGWDCVDKNADYVLTGTYWPHGNSVKFLAALRRVADGSLVSAAEASMPGKAVLSSGLGMEPQNFARAMADMKVFETDELAGGGLSIEAWTDKGPDGAVYTRGEKMTVTIRVNLPSYIRLVYHLANGKRALLLDNYSIGSDKVNVPYTLPYEFECDAPYGPEVLQAMASTEKFEPLRTTAGDGYDYLAEDLHDAVMKSRGMKKKSSSYKAETRVTITTMAR